MEKQYTAAMLVKALRLFHREVKLTAAELRAQTPMVGRLRYEDSQYAGRDGRGPRKCLLMPLDLENTTPLCELFSAKMKIDEKGIRVRGEEDEWRRKERTAYKQVLWCWPHDGVEVRVEVTPPVDYSRAGRRAIGFPKETPCHSN
jgi:hypothetical protein